MGLIGLGNMGTAFAERVLEAGHPLVVHNRTPGKTDAIVERGATVAQSPAELAETVDVILTSLADDEAFEQVVEQILTAARPGTR